MAKLDANASLLESRIHALSTSLEGPISYVSGNVQETVNINIKEKMKHTPDYLGKLKRDLHNGMQLDFKSFQGLHQVHGEHGQPRHQEHHTIAARSINP